MDQIEMWWKCKSCKTINGGLSKKCGERVIVNGKVVLDSGGCGKPLSHEEWIMPGDISTNVNLSGKDIEQALEGEDWHCHYCNSNQRNSNGDCCVCGGDRKNKEESQVDPEVIIKQTKRQVLNLYGGLLVLVALASLVYGLVWLFTPTYINTKIEKVNWTSTVEVEKYKRVYEDGWTAPFDAEEVHNNGPRIHHYDHVLTGSHQESYYVQEPCGQTCTSVSIPRSCTSNRNGTARCSGGGTERYCSTRYCDRIQYRRVNDYTDVPRYQNYYGWFVWRWRHDRNVIAFGNDFNIYEPNESKIALNIHCTGKEQERKFTATFEYKCIFKDKKGNIKDYKPKTDKEFRNCQIGRSVKFKQSFGNITLEKWN